MNKRVVIEVLTEPDNTPLIMQMAKCPNCGECNHAIKDLIEDYRDSLEAELECQACNEVFTLHVRNGPLH